MLLGYIKAPSFPIIREKRVPRLHPKATLYCPKQGKAVCTFTITYRFLYPGI